MVNDENSSRKPLRVLHSFPHRLGKARICTTAWYEIDSVAEAGASVLAIAGDCVRPFRREKVTVQRTLALGPLRFPYRLLGARRMCMIHDWMVARRLPGLAGKIDIIHAWPLGALRTMRAARKLGIPVALERCNAHTRFAYTVVQKECERIGVPLPRDHEHAFNQEILDLEEAEYREADGILCPSDFVVDTFLNEGHPREKLVRFIYGVDEKKYFPAMEERRADRSLTMIYVGVCAVRKGLHFALEAWLKSEASKTGTFLIVGEFIPEYRAYLAPMLSHPSVKVLGHRNDVPDLMRAADVFILPSIEEGFGLVCTEAMASGCVPLVSSACTDLCEHDVDSLVHKPGNVAEITAHIDSLQRDRALWAHLRAQGLAKTPSLTWSAAGRSISQAYQTIVKKKMAQ